jgi:hypothetical protein
MCTRRFSQICVAILISASINIATPDMSTALASEHAVGGISVADFCNFLIGSSQWEVYEDDPTSWVCKKPITYTDSESKQRNQISVTVHLDLQHFHDACEMQYPDIIPVYARVDNWQDAYSLKCYTNNHYSSGPAYSFEYNPKITRLGSKAYNERELGGISVVNYCTILVGSSAWEVSDESTPDSWTCVKERHYTRNQKEYIGPIRIKLDQEHFDAMCRNQYSSATTYAKFTNKHSAYSGRCMEEEPQSTPVISFNVASLRLTGSNFERNKKVDILVAACCASGAERQGQVSTQSDEDGKIDAHLDLRKILPPFYLTDGYYYGIWEGCYSFEHVDISAKLSTDDLWRAHDDFYCP